MSTHITINGQTYQNVEAMPAGVRREYEAAMALLADRNGNGIPDILEGKGTSITMEDNGPLHKTILAKSLTRIVLNGKEYASLEEVPASMRHALENAMRNSPAIPGVEIVRSGKTLSVPGIVVSSGDGVKFSLGTVIVIAIVAAIGGILIAHLVWR